MTRRTLLVLLTLLPLAGAAGCRFQPRRRDFTAVLGDYNRRLAKAGYNFRTAVDPLRKGEQPNSAQVHAAYDDIVKTLKEVRREVDNLDPPYPSQSAPNLLQAYKDWLTLEETYPEEYYQKMVQAVDNNDLTVAQKWQIVSAELVRMYNNDSDAYTTVKAMENSYCGEHHYQPMPYEMLNKDK